MADSTIATKEVENWIRSEFLQKKYNQIFAKRKLGVQFRPAHGAGRESSFRTPFVTGSGGEFECDAVSEDGTIVCFISTSSSKTDTGVIAKIRDNAFWAGSLSEKPQEIVFAFTDKSMVELIKQEKENGRFPKHIKTLLIKLPAWEVSK